MRTIRTPVRFRLISKPSPSWTCTLKTQNRRIFSFFPLFYSNFFHSNSCLKDNDVHLSGVAAMFLATKYEDIYHIPLRDFLSRVAHNKFKGLEIKAKEWDIMTALNFDISFPTYYSFYERFFWKSFNAEVNSNYMRSIEETGVHILRMVLYNANLMKYRPHILGLSVLFLAVHTLFEELINKNKVHKEVLKIQEKEIV